MHLSLTMDTPEVREFVQCSGVTSAARTMNTLVNSELKVLSVVGRWGGKG